MGKLHELIAVEKDRKATAAKIVEETEVTFSKKQNLFSGFTRVYEPKTDDKEMFDSEESQVVTTVPDKLDYFEDHMINLMDVIIQKEKTNIGLGLDVGLLLLDNHIHQIDHVFLEIIKLFGNCGHNLRFL